MALRTLNVEEAINLKGQSLGVTDWKTITQDLVNLFAKATGDNQWIHIDVERAAKESPFRKTIAHGYFTQALVPAFFWELLEITGVRLVINYGSNRVRWPGPAPIPSRLRMSAKVNDVEVLENGFSLLIETAIEVENQQRPAMIAEVIYRYYT